MPPFHPSATFQSAAAKGSYGMVRPRVGQNARAADRPRAVENQLDVIEDKAEPIIDLLRNPIRQDR
jgi:hypothetical protein